MRHRVFIAINLPEEVKKELSSFQEKWPDLPCRWTKKESLHITFLFLGSLSDEELFWACKIVGQVALRNKSFWVNLKRICYGPPGKKLPNMVWVKGESSAEINSLKSDLEKSLMERVRFRLEGRAFSPHITLGRIRTWDFKNIEPEDRPDIEQEISLDFEVSSIEVMESQLKRTGAEYEVLESVKLKSTQP